MAAKVVKWIDLLAAVYLMILFPALSIHVKMREKLFDACVICVREYGEMLQKQGFLSDEMMEKFFGQTAGVLENADIALWKIGKEGERKLLTEEVLNGEGYEYAGKTVYPFWTGEQLLFQIRMPYDGMEKAYYCFVGGMAVREYTCFFEIRDGLLER